MDLFVSLVFLVAMLNSGFVYGEFKLQILHTNDMHARFDETDEDSAACSMENAKEHKCYGGFARIKKAADLLKADAAKKNISSIFLNAGDTFQGTPYYSVYKWKIAASLMNLLGFDAMCLGNHEFDDGIQNLVQYLEHTKIPTVAANLNRTSEKRLNALVKDSIVLNIKSHKIGVVGYITPDTMILSATEDLEIFDEIPYLRAEAKRLKSQGVNFIIGLGHSGLVRDKEIAAAVEELDLIIGGHSHSLLYNPKDKPPSKEAVVESYPFWVTQKSGKRVPIVQSFAHTKYLGNMTLTIDDHYKLIAVEGNSYLLDDSYKKDGKVKNKVEIWTTKLRKKLQIVVGKTAVSLTKSTFAKNGFESNFANLVTDALFEQGVLQTKKNNLSQWTEFAAAVYQHGGIRTQFSFQRNGGNLTIEDILTALPFQSPLYQCRLSGKELKEALEISVMRFKPTQRYAVFFIHFSGLRVIYDLRRAPGERVKNVNVLCTKCPIPRYEVLQNNETYPIILNSYLAQGGDNFGIFKTACRDIKNFGFVAADAVVDYIQRRQVVYPILDGRLKTIEEDEKPSSAIRITWSLYNLFLITSICIRAAI